MAGPLDWLMQALGGGPAQRQRDPVDLEALQRYMNLLEGPSELPPPNDIEQFAIGGEAGARRYRDRVRGFDLNTNPQTRFVPKEGIWPGDLGIYGGPRTVSAGQDEVLPGLAQRPFFPSQLVLPEAKLWNDWQARSGFAPPATGRLIEEAPYAKPQGSGDPLSLDFWRTALWPELR